MSERRLAVLVERESPGDLWYFRSALALNLVYSPLLIVDGIATGRDYWNAADLVRRFGS